MSRRAGAIVLGVGTLMLGAACTTRPALHSQASLSAELVADGVLSGPGDDMMLVLSADEREGFLTRREKAGEPYRTYRTEWTGLGWSPAVPLPIPGYGSDQSPAILQQGARLLFSSDRRRGDSVGVDLFRTCRDGNRWSIPEPLDTRINSPADDRSRSLARMASTSGQRAPGATVTVTSTRSPVNGGLPGCCPRPPTPMDGTPAARCHPTA
jgi:hypothetical protein